MHRTTGIPFAPHCSQNGHPRESQIQSSTFPTIGSTGHEFGRAQRGDPMAQLDRFQHAAGLKCNACLR
jgi:hypothetical protein